MTDRNSTTQNPPTQPKKRGGNRKPMTTEQYLAKARKKHGPKFDYSLVAYKHSTKPITIICPTHGNFEQKAHEHLRSKYGCQECAKEIAAEGKKLTTAEFIKNAKAKHGSKFDYSKSVYIDSATEVEIICPEHGPFFRTPNNHINGGYGCNECNSENVYDTDYFIERAKEAHRDRGVEYDYSKVEYKSAGEPVEIICKEHGSFFQAPQHHLKPHGCPKCAGNSKTTFSDFIERAKAKHGNKYTYDRSSYTAQRNKVKIHCSDHGWFELKGTAHINGAGCYVCSGRTRQRYSLTWEIFCAEADKKYKGQYKYTEGKFKGTASRVEIVCTECNTTFKQNAKTHLDTDVTPCPTCREQERREAHAKRYEARARKRHKGQFSYPEPVYDIDMGKATFHCNVCDKDFIQDPRHHIKSKGCPHCMAEERRKKGGAEFIAKASELHDDLYDYSKVDFYDSDTHVAIICSEHGEFKQRPYKHLMKKGCPECGMLKNAGWTRTNYIEFCQDYADGQATLYAIRCFKAGEEFLKVGITAYSVARRFKTDMPYDYTVLYEINADAGYIYDLEKRLHRILRKKEKRYIPKIPFGGYTECFSTIKPIESLLKELTTTEQMQLIA